ncbi:MAG: hypothetical protein AB4372_18110 [Xenococcus sp. (in: cyanobacteria)]
MSRKFLYQQQQKGNQALELGFNQQKDESDILYWIPVTKNWIFQLILGLIFICHSSYRGVVEILRDLFDYPISVGTVHNRVQSVVAQAQEINKSQDLSRVKVGLKDEIFQSRLPVLAGIDAFSTYWGWYNYHLHSFSIQGIEYGEPQPDYGWDIQDETKVKLNQVIKSEKAKFSYSY